MRRDCAASRENEQATVHQAFPVIICANPGPEQARNRVGTVKRACSCGIDSILQIMWWKAVAVLLVRDGERCTRARVATAGISSHSVRLHAAEQILEGEGLAEIALAHAADKAAEVVEPVSDQNASAEFRRHLTRVLTRRALIRAAAAAT